jgi:hypothetical protein
VRNAFLYIPLILIAICGTVRPLPAADSARAAQKDSPKSASKTAADFEIERKIQAKLAKSKLAADHFTASVSHGVATLDGVTDVAQHKGVMTRMAKSAGAASVRNNIQVTAKGRARAAAAFAKARSRAAGVATRTGASGSPAKRSNSTQLPHATVLPQN